MNKINQILQEWPAGTVITSNWLNEKGVYKQLADSYENSGWLMRIGRGAYKRKGEEISWESGLYTLLKLQSLSIHAGGKTALESQGFGHYIKMGGEQRVILWKTPETRLPAWFKNYAWKVNMEIRSAQLFIEEVNALSTRKLDGIEVEISSAERAIIEYLYDIPAREGFDEANYIMEGLSTLRPQILQQLLEACKSVKVKRLFMYIAEYYNHAWFKRLNSSRIDFGKGKREIIKGGKYNKKYKIVVPELSREDQ